MGERDFVIKLEIDSGSESNEHTHPSLEPFLALPSDLHLTAAQSCSVVAHTPTDVMWTGACECLVVSASLKILFNFI